MTLICASIIALIFSYSVAVWRHALRCELRWEFFALRDELRRAAVESPEVAEHDAFSFLDWELTYFAGHVDNLSIWSALPYLLTRRGRRMTARAAAQLHSLCTDDDTGVLQSVNDRLNRLISRALVVRHPAIVITTLCVAVPPALLMYAFGSGTKRLARATQSLFAIPAARAASAA